MTTQKKPKQQQGFSVNAIALKLKRDRATITRATSGLAPIRREGTVSFFELADVEAALAAKSDKTLKDEKLSEEIRKLRLKNDRDEGKLILVDSVKSCVSRVLARVDQILEQKLSNEYPAAVAGLDVPQSRIYGKRLGDQIRVEFQGLKEEWK